MRHGLRQAGTLLGFAGIIAFFAWQLPDTFLTPRNLINISQQLSMLAVVAATMTIVMVMGDFDLSVGSMASLAGIVAAMLFVAGYPVWVGLGAALLVGFCGGVFNGVLVSVFGILPFVATLGTLTVFSGTAFLISDGRTIFGRDIPAGFSSFARGGVPLDGLGLEGVALPFLTLCAAAVIFACWFLLHKTVPGRRLYAIGGNREAARLSGINVTWLRILAFGLTGLGAATAGLMLAARVASANPTQGAGLMLDAIAAVFLGMTMTRQGEPRVLYTLVGVVMLGILDNGLTQMRVDSYVREILVGLIVITAVGVASYSKARRR
ncbi:ABC transporter permease [Gymnodinialimonas sp. 2305UL16-5]|uniref:ABC transporter permease n=1 Tax=Gymnodinialimonas mytili TaxID=3126503 RepID=UPI003099EA1F